MGRKLGFEARFGTSLAAVVRAVSIIGAIVTASFLVAAVHNLSVFGELSFLRRRLPSAYLGSRADWTNKSQLPQFCQVLRGKPAPRERYCHRDFDTMKCRNSSTVYQMFSQYEQDDFVYHAHFQHLKRRGIYLDIAANDPVKISNTFFMDRCLGWQGICVEADPQYYDRLYSLRSCQIVPTCVGSTEGQTVEFRLEGGLGGILGDTYKNIERFEGSEGKTRRMRCTTMKSVLERNAITVVDFLSLDVEGHELEVLRGFDWNNVVINVMSIEVSKSTLPEIEEFLTPRGYRRFVPEFNERGDPRLFLHADAVFLHEAVDFGNPR